MLAGAEIIAIGSELLTPHRIDSNSLYLTTQLNSIGIEVELIDGKDLNSWEKALKKINKLS